MSDYPDDNLRAVKLEAGENRLTVHARQSERNSFVPRYTAWCGYVSANGFELLDVPDVLSSVREHVAAA